MVNGQLPAATAMLERAVAIPIATPRANRRGYLSMREAADLCPAPSSRWTCNRWARKGLLARNGRGFYMRHVRVGKRIYTRPEWVCSFLEAVAVADHSTCGDAPAGGSTPQAPDRQLLRWKEGAEVS